MCENNAKISLLCEKLHKSDHGQFEMLVLLYWRGQTGRVISFRLNPNVQTSPPLADFTGAFAGSLPVLRAVQTHTIHPVHKGLQAGFL